jgi:hypothetical protein
MSYVDTSSLQKHACLKTKDVLVGVLIRHNTQRVKSIKVKSVKVLDSSKCRACCSSIDRRRKAIYRWCREVQGGHGIWGNATFGTCVVAIWNGYQCWSVHLFGQHGYRVPCGRAEPFHFRDHLPMPMDSRNWQALLSWGCRYHQDRVGMERAASILQDIPPLDLQTDVREACPSTFNIGSPAQKSSYSPSWNHCTKGRPKTKRKESQSRREPFREELPQTKHPEAIRPLSAGCGEVKGVEWSY